MTRATILVVDDDAALRVLLEEQLRALGYSVLAAGSAEQALRLLEMTTPDLILTDVHMGAMSGVELCARVKSDPRFQLIPVIILTARSDRDARVAGLGAGADDFFSKPFDPLELRTRVAALLRVKTLVDRLERAESVITTLGLTVEARDPYTAGHCERLGRYAVALGRLLEVDEAAREALWLGGYLHDLGKIAVPDPVLLKPGRLEANERAIIELHPVTGADLVQHMRTMDLVRPIIRHHHERWDGSGYPDRLRGEEIPRGARIMAVVDVYDALRTRRCYKPALPHQESISILVRETEAGSWDSRIVGTFVEMLRELGPDMVPAGEPVERRPFPGNPTRSAAHEPRGIR